MKALFNGWCEDCKRFRSRCAAVYPRALAPEVVARGVRMVLCPDCRKLQKGRLRYDDRHK